MRGCCGRHDRAAFYMASCAGGRQQEEESRDGGQKELHLEELDEARPGGVVVGNAGPHREDLRVPGRVVAIDCVGEQAGARVEHCLAHRVRGCVGLGAEAGVVVSAMRLKRSPHPGLV